MDSFVQMEPIVFENGDVYRGARDCDGRRQGKGCCDYGAATETVDKTPTAATGGGGGDDYYSGDWDADKPHGRGERVYAAPRQTRGIAGGEREGLDATIGEEDDMAIVIAAFGPSCPPMASYRGDFKRGIREGYGMCSFFPPGVAVSGDAPGCSAASSTLLIPESYDGEWVGGRPLGRGVLSLRAAPATASGNAYPSSVKRSGSTMMRRGTAQNGGGGNGRGSLIEGVWTEEGLIHGREKLPSKGGVYEGQYRLGRREGHGRLDLPDGSEYEGEWLKPTILRNLLFLSRVYKVSGLIESKTLKFMFGEALSCQARWSQTVTFCCAIFRKQKTKTQ